MSLQKITLLVTKHSNLFSRYELLTGYQQVVIKKLEFLTKLPKSHGLIALFCGIMRPL